MPGVGRTLSAGTEERARHVRKAVDFLEPELRSGKAEADYTSAFAPRWEGGHAAALQEPVSVRAAWALVNVWLLARMAGAVKGGASFLDAERWFAGPFQCYLPSLAAHIPPDVAGLALRALFGSLMMQTCWISFPTYWNCTGQEAGSV